MFEGKNYICGEFKDDVNHFVANNPATEQPYGVFPRSSTETVNEAVQQARVAQKKWKIESRINRADKFDKLAQLLKSNHISLQETISIETGKSLNEAHAEVVEMLHMCQTIAGMGRQSYGELYSSELSEKDVYVTRKPRGVVAVISPWNFPLLGAFWCSGPAILEGNSVVHKPSELTPMVNQLAAQLYHEAGFPPGVFNVIHGDGSTGAALVRADVDVILFTGSAEVGQDIKRHCAETFTKTCSIECGSKSATMVFADGEWDLALKATLASAFKLSGQRCVSSSRILIERSIYDSFCKEFAEKAGRLTVGNPFWNVAPDYGPMISAEQRDKVIAYNQLVRDDKEADVLLDGKVGKEGYSLFPFVYKCEWSEKPYLKQEVFGPHVALIPFNDIDDAIRIYNDTEFGLALGVITDDFRKHRKLVQECTTGMLYINGGSIAAESHLPFSSWKKSGWGSSAANTWKAVTHPISVTTNYEKGISWAQGLK